MGAKITGLYQEDIRVACVELNSRIIAGMAAKFETVMMQLKAGNYAPVYLLHGSEAYYIDQLADYIEEHALQESEKVFNQIILYGKEVNSKTVIDHASQYPMMAQRRVVILKEAQSMRDLAKLEPYVRNPATTTVLVIAHPHKKLDGRSALSKTLNKHAVVFESQEVKEYKMAQWIEGYLKDSGYTIEPGAADVLVDYLGNDLSKVSNELDKLALSMGERKQVKREDVYDNIGVSKDYNVFELQTALALRDSQKVYKIVENFMANSKAAPFVVVNATLFSYFSKVLLVKSMEGKSDRAIASAIGVNPYFLKEYKAASRNFSVSALSTVIDILRQYDMRSKGINRTSALREPELLREMIYKIFNVTGLRTQASQASGRSR